MQNITTLAALAVLTAGFAGCQGAADDAESTTVKGTANGATTTDSNEPAASATDPAAERRWSAGDTIPSGKPGVPDIEILEVHANGTGEVCGVGRRATLDYTAMLANGEVIDPGLKPFTFRVGAQEAIAGWDLIVAQMRVGDSFTVTVPQQLAYGPSRGDLKFDMELLSFE